MRLIKQFPLLKFAATILSSLSGCWTQERLKVMMEYEFVLQLCVTSISKPLQVLYKNRFDNECFPQTWKNANIVPIHKKGKAAEKNYRPVSIFPILEKNFQKIIFNALFKYLDDNNLLKNNQSGFRSSGSCAHQLLAITRDIYL